MAAALGWLALDFVERRRTRRPRPSGATRSRRDRVTRLSFAAAAITVLGLGPTSVLLWALVADTSLDLLHFSLHPLSAGRLAVAFALVLLHAAVIWAAVAIIRAAAHGHARLAPSRRGVAGQRSPARSSPPP